MRENSLRRLFGQDVADFWNSVIAEADHIREIRMRIGQPILVRRTGNDVFLDEQGFFTDLAERAHKVTQQELDDFLMRICQGSPYAFEDMLRQGFLTVPGGHRIGMAGQTVCEESGRIRTMKHLYYLNIRISHQIFGVADRILPDLYEEGEVRNTLIISPPGAGKTTLLRELIRKVSDGNPYGRARNVGVVDERSELSGSYLGCPQNDLGCRTDVLTACPKVQGMFLLLRSMAPEVMAVDELGGREDVEALRAAAVCGCKVLATVHGRDPEDAKKRFPELFADNLFERFVVPKRRAVNNANSWGNSDPERQFGTWIVVSEEIYRQSKGAADIGQNIGIVSGRNTVRKSGYAGML